MADFDPNRQWRMENPDARTVQQLKREQELRAKKVRSSSVSQGQYGRAMGMTTMVVIAVCAVVAIGLIYLGITSFLPSH